MAKISAKVVSRKVDQGPHTRDRFGTVVRRARMIEEHRVELTIDSSRFTSKQTYASRQSAAAAAKRIEEKFS